MEIPIDKINENEGTITFKLSKGNLFDDNTSLLKIQCFNKNDTIFCLERDSSFNLNFIQSNPNYPTKIASVDISSFKDKNSFRVTYSWSKEKNNLYFGTCQEDLISAESEANDNISLRVDKFGKIIRIGDTGVKVKSVMIQSQGQIILEPKAKEIFDFGIERIDLLIKNGKISDFLFETTISQQVIVMLTSLFEVYMKTRFLELEHENYSVNLEELYFKFVPKSYRDKFVKDVQSRTEDGKSELSVFINDKIQINFQSWEYSKKAYKSGYGIKLSDYATNPQDIEQIQKFLKWRHMIIHSKQDCSLLNIMEVPPKEPIFSNIDLAKKGRDLFVDFIKNFHDSTLKKD